MKKDPPIPRAEARRKGMKMPPKYRQIADSLFAQIRSTYRPGDKLPGEVELAEAFGVHVMTVREAMKILQDGGVIQRKSATGTVVLNPMGGKWVAILSELDLFSPLNNAIFHQHFVYHVRRGLMARGLPSRISIGSIELNQDSSISTCFDFWADVEADRLSGLVALSTIPVIGWLDKMIRRGTPVVGTAPQYPAWVSFDECAAYTKVFRRLATLGRKKTAWIGWLGRTPSHAHPINRLLKKITSATGAEFKPEHIIGNIHPMLPRAGQTQIKKLFRKNKLPVEVVLIADENLLHDALVELELRNISIPDDVILICGRSAGNPHIPIDDRIIYVDHAPLAFANGMVEALMRQIEGGVTKEGETRIEPLITWGTKGWD